MPIKLSKEKTAGREIFMLPYNLIDKK